MKTVPHTLESLESPGDFIKACVSLLESWDFSNVHFTYCSESTATFTVSPKSPLVKDLLKWCRKERAREGAHTYEVRASHSGNLLGRMQVSVCGNLPPVVTLFQFSY